MIFRYQELNDQWISLTFYHVSVDRHKSTFNSLFESTFDCCFNSIFNQAAVRRARDEKLGLGFGLSLDGALTGGVSPRFQAVLGSLGTFESHLPPATVWVGPGRVLPRFHQQRPPPILHQTTPGVERRLLVPPRPLLHV